MEKTNLELRMYGFVPYNLSEIQKGIQFGHAVVEYGLKHSKDKDYIEWAKHHKTFIILNGGTSNAGQTHPFLPTIVDQGSMEDIADLLVGNGIKFAKFYEPDLNWMLSGICLLVDERVFDREKYPDFIECLVDEKGANFSSEDYIKLKMMSEEKVRAAYPKRYAIWLKLLGGEKILFLRTYLKQFKLA